jgi:hypothetical protein
VVVREYYSGANSMGPYLLAKCIYQLPENYATVLLSICLYWMSGEQKHANSPRDSHPKAIAGGVVTACFIVNVREGVGSWGCGTTRGIQSAGD